MVVGGPDDGLLAQVVVRHRAAGGSGLNDGQAFGFGVGFAVARMAAQPVTKEAVADGFGAVGTEDMNIGRRFLEPKTAVQPGSGSTMTRGWGTDGPGTRAAAFGSAS